MAAFRISLLRWLSVLGLILCSMPTSGGSTTTLVCNSYSHCSNGDSYDAFTGDGHCNAYSYSIDYNARFYIRSLSTKCTDGSDYRFTILDLRNTYSISYMQPNSIARGTKLRIRGTHSRFEMQSSSELLLSGDLLVESSSSVVTLEDVTVGDDFRLSNSASATLEEMIVGRDFILSNFASVTLGKVIVSRDLLLSYSSSVTVRGTTPVTVSSRRFSNQESVSGTYIDITGELKLSCGSSIVLSGEGAEIRAGSLKLTTDGYSSCTSGSQITITGNSSITVDGTLTLEESTRISADGTGFSNRNGPGSGTSNYQGGSHGGRGYGHYCTSSSAISNYKCGYGLLKLPLEKGSGGYNGNGGGVIIIEAESIVNNGVIRSKGSDGSGAGAGGSIILRTDSYSGSGHVTAAGGRGTGGGGSGGGGRVALLGQGEQCTLPQDFEQQRFGASSPRSDQGHSGFPGTV